MAPIRQLQHLLVHWDLNKNHTGVFTHMSKQTNQQNLGRQYLTKRTLIIPKQYTPFQEPKNKDVFHYRPLENENYLDGELAPAALFIVRKCALPRAWSDLVAKGYIWLWRGFRVFDVKAWKNFTRSSSPVSSPMKMHLGKETRSWLQLVSRRHPAFWADSGKGCVCENRGREGAERGFVSWLPRILCFNLPFLFFIFFSNLTKWICLFFFSLDGKWLQWLSPLIFIELKFHWPPFLHEAYFIPWWSAGLDIRPS